MTLPSLIKRLEEAEGPSRELDGDIHNGVFKTEYVRVPNSVTGFLTSKTDNGCPTVPPYSSSVDAAISLAERVLPGWMWKLGTCSVSDDAWVAPDFNSPAHGERLKRELNYNSMKAGDPLDVGFDIDQRPPGREAIALCRAVLEALHHVNESSSQAQEASAK